MKARAIPELYYNTYCAHKELSLTCVARARFELLSYYERLLWERRSRYSIVRKARK